MKRAEQAVSQLAQVPSETYSTYVEDVLKLCNVVNGQMLEEDNFGHLL